MEETVQSEPEIQTALDAGELRTQVLLATKRFEVLKENPSKDVCRNLHHSAVEIELARNAKWINWAYDRYLDFFADGSDIRPSQIAPTLVEVQAKWQSDLFRLARFTWSLPYTKGYGRRLRFLIMDQSNSKLIGILGLQSPPLDFPARDRLFAYPKGKKVELVNRTMDIYTLGAVHPYARLLGGKLVALSAISDEVRRAYKRKYAGRVTEIEGRTIPASLLALTTTSAFGRSSLYNRITFRGRKVPISLNYTEGYGSFHLASLYPLFCQLLGEQGVSSKGGFGVGPRIVWQTHVRALERIGLDADLLRHGVKREAFLFPLVENLKDIMEGKSGRPQYYHQSFRELASWWRERWLLPRAGRVDGWHLWDRSEVSKALFVQAVDIH